MKKLAAVVFIATIFLFSSCEPAATFSNLQPEGVKAMASFPQRLQGNYLAEDQASVISITSTSITRYYDYDYKVQKDSLGTFWKIEGDSLRDLTDGSVKKISVSGDSVIVHESWTDTLFLVSADNILKKFKGYYFLNSRFRENAWEVKKLWLKKGVLTIGIISDEKDLQTLREITETTADTVSTHFNVSRRQFKNFIRQDGFGEQESFTRIKEQ